MCITRFKRFLCFFFIFLFFSANIFSQRRTSHIDSDSIYSFLISKDIQPKILPNKSKNTAFPYNIVINFSKNNNLTNEQSEGMKKSNTLIISAVQEDIPLFLDELLAYIEHLKNEPPPIDVQIVLTAGDTSAIRQIDSTQANKLEGTNMFLSSLDSTKQYTALLLNIRTFTTERNRKILVTPGIPYKAAPSWLLDAVIKSCKTKNIPLKIDGLFLSFYRAGLLQQNPKLSAYFNENIPALFIEGSSTEIFNALPVITDKIADTAVTIWDYHYNMITIGEKTFFIPEIVLLIILLGTAGISLFYLSIFSFFTKYNTSFQLSELKKSWFLLPLMIIITWLFFYASQLLSQKLYSNWIFHLFSACFLKASLALLMFSILALAHRFISFPTNDYAYAYLLIIISFANIFIFASFDLSLLLVFSVELVLALIFSKVKHTFLMIIIAFLMLVPFSAFAYAIFTMPRQNILYRFFNASFAENALIACLIIPIEFTWVRIAVKLKIFGKNHKKNRFPYIISISIFLTTIISAVIIAQGFYQTKFNFLPISYAEQSTLDALSFETKRTKVMNRNRIDLQINSSEMILKLNIKVIANKGIAVYDANFPFETMNANQQASFVLGDYPPNPFIVQFTCEDKIPIEIEISAYLKTKERKIVQETKILRINPIGEN